MTSNGKKKYFLDPIIDSDDSDYECLHGKMIEELRYEIDVARFYKALNEDLVGLNSNKTSERRKKISKAVQTDPDTSGIPQSWMNFSEELVSQLYTGLANMINTLYHTPYGYCKEDTNKDLSITPDLKFFTYENGFWQSKLLPQVKIPATVGISRQIHSENFKSDLSSLLEKATKLRNIFSFIMENGGDDRTMVESEISETDTSESTPTKQSDLLGKTTFHVGGCSSKDPSEKSDIDSVVSGSTMGSRARANKSPATCNAQKQSNREVSKRSIAQSHDTNPKPGVLMSKCKLPQQAFKSVKVSVPKQHASKKLVGHTSEGNRNNRNGDFIMKGIWPKTSTPIGKVVGYDRCADNAPVVKDMHGKVEKAFNSNREKRNNERNFNASGKSACSSNEGKNFIKMNILASKLAVHRGATTSRITRDGQPSGFLRTETVCAKTKKGGKIIRE